MSLRLFSVIALVGISLGCNQSQPLTFENSLSATRLSEIRSVAFSEFLYSTLADQLLDEIKDETLQSLRERIKTEYGVEDRENQDSVIQVVIFLEAKFGVLNSLSYVATDMSEFEKALKSKPIGVPPCSKSTRVGERLRVVERGSFFPRHYPARWCEIEDTYWFFDTKEWKLMNGYQDSVFRLRKT